MILAVGRRRRPRNNGRKQRPRAIAALGFWEARFCGRLACDVGDDALNLVRGPEGLDDVDDAALHGDDEGLDHAGAVGDDGLFDEAG